MDFSPCNLDHHMEVVMGPSCLLGSLDRRSMASVASSCLLGSLDRHSKALLVFLLLLEMERSHRFLVATVQDLPGLETATQASQMESRHQIHSTDMRCFIERFCGLFDFFVAQMAGC